MAERDAEAFAVVGESIGAVGTLSEMRARFRDAEWIDFGNAVVVPGFNDAHMHPAMAAENLLHLDLSPMRARSLPKIAQLLRDSAAHTPHGRWIRASRYDDAQLGTGERITRDFLDSATRAHPVLVVHVAGHWGVLNSAGLKKAGIDERSGAPAGGRHGRDAAGRLDGTVYEQALFDLAFPAIASRPIVIPPSTQEDRLDGLHRALDLFASSGLTAVTDALTGPSELELFEEAYARDLLSLRVNVLVTYKHFEALRRLGLRTGFGGSHLRIAGIKVFVDGAIGGRTCLLAEPFERTNDFGIQSTSTEDLARMVTAVHGAGCRLAVHANGDRAIAILLDQLEAAQLAHPRADPRHRIEHCSIVTSEILARMRQLGCVAVPFGSYVHYYGARLLDWYGPVRADRMFAHRAFLDAGVPVAGSSDFPCGPFEPLLAIQSCVTRMGADGTAVGVSQRIGTKEALALYTLGSAFATGEETTKGRIAPAYLADFVVLGEDPLVVEPRELAAIAVLGTYVGGEKVWPRS